MCLQCLFILNPIIGGVLPDQWEAHSLEPRVPAGMFGLYLASTKEQGSVLVPDGLSYTDF